MKNVPFVKQALTVTFLFALFLSMKSPLRAQVTVNGTSATTSAAMAILPKGDYKGFLPPKINFSERTASYTAVNGLIVFDTNMKSFFYRFGSGTTTTDWWDLNPWKTNTITTTSSNSGTGTSDMYITLVNNIGVGLTNPGSKFSILGNMAIGSNYADLAAPTDGLIVEGKVGIGKSNPSTALDVNGTITAKAVNATSGQGIIPIGGIIMWSGINIPSGWQLCDGSTISSGTLSGQRTPNLKGRFIVGYDPTNADYDDPGQRSEAGGDNSLGNRGGLESVILDGTQGPIHNHVATANTNGDHHHKLIGVDISDATPSTTNHLALRTNAGNYEEYNLKGTTIDPTIARSDVKGDHSHTITVENAGGTTPHENRPPYFVLAFIMRVL